MKQSQELVQFLVVTTSPDQALPLHGSTPPVPPPLPFRPPHVSHSPTSAFLTSLNMFSPVKERFMK
ncbi:hypothetical protein E2C01_066221 [Portunus trituberculatus]|uniref:Uncharacterized protein n=1 Tax=Portunus trituberculatus TaxID=210409 RepID=A0A5B7HQC8_PORTR|nr:hypothetical protein [Portunus trituberculatus]